MRAFNTAVISTLLVAMSHLVQSQDCDFVDDQACCYTSTDSNSAVAYCCNGSVRGNFGSGSDDASALNDLICCQDDGITNINIGYARTTCVAGSATPLTAKGTAASTVADAIKSISASKSASRESLFSSISASTASAAAASSASATGSGASSAMTSSTTSSASSSGSVSRSASGSSTSGAAAGTTSSGASTAAATTSPTSTGGVAMMTVDAWNVAMAGGVAFVAAML